MSTEPQAPAEVRTPQTRKLDRSLIHGIAWTGGGRWAVQIISWIATPIVASLLSPSDYGVASMALVYVGLVQLINEFGLGGAIVQRRDLTHDQIAKLGGLSVLLGVFFFLLSIALAFPVARFFGNPDVGPVIVALGVTFPASSFQALPRALLTRELRFRRLAVLDAVEGLVSITTTLLLAALGFRYWALVFGSILSRVATTILAVLSRPHRLQWPTQFKTIAAPVFFGSHMVVSSIAWYVYLNADLTVVGRRLGTAALGAYSIGLTLASIPVDRLSALLSRATPAIFSTVQHDRSLLRRYVLALTEGTALLTFPAAIGLALVAREFVLVVLGEEWTAAITPLRLLAVAAVFRSLIPVLGQVLFATGESKRNMHATMAIALVLPPLFYAGSAWGTAGVALVWLVAYPIVSAAFFVRYAFAACKMSVASYLRALWPATSAVVVMAAAVLLAEVVSPPAWPLPLMLAIKCVVGAVTYAAIVWWLHGSRLRSFVAIVRERHPSDTPAIGEPPIPRAEAGA